MPLGNQNLIGRTREQSLTFPGQADFAIPNSERHCFECEFWAPRGKSGDKKAVCLKAAALLRNARPPLVPRHATICKFFKDKL